MTNHARWLEKTNLGDWTDVTRRSSISGTATPIFSFGFGSAPTTNASFSVSTIEKTPIIADTPYLSGLGTDSQEFTIDGSLNSFVIWNLGSSPSDASANLDWTDAQGFILIEINDPGENLGYITLQPMAAFSVQRQIRVWAPGGSGDIKTSGFHLLPITLNRPVSTGSAGALTAINRLRFQIVRTGTLGVDDPMVTFHAMALWSSPSGPTRLRVRIDDGVQNPTTGHETLAHTLALNAAGIPVSLGIITPPPGTGSQTLSPAQLQQILSNPIEGRPTVTNALHNHLTNQTANSDNWATPDPDSDRTTDNKKYFLNCRAALIALGTRPEHASFLIVPQGSAYNEDDDIWADSPLLTGMSWTGSGWGSGELSANLEVNPYPLPHPCVDNAVFWSKFQDPATELIPYTPELFIKTLIGTSGSTVEDLGEVEEFSSGGSEGANFIVKSDGLLAQIGKGKAATLTIYWHAPNHSTAEATRMAAYLSVLQANSWITTDNLTELPHLGLLPPRSTGSRTRHRGASTEFYNPL